jgi:hypothetical protein
VCNYTSREIFPRRTNQRHVMNVRWSWGLLLVMGSLTCKKMYGITYMSAFIEESFGDLVSLSSAPFSFRTASFVFFFIFYLVCESPLKGFKHNTSIAFSWDIFKSFFIDECVYSH